MTERQFEAIFKTHFSYLSNVAFSIVKDEDDAYDIVQQVFIKFWDKRFDINIEDNIKSYLHRAAFNTSLNFIDKNKRKIKIEDEQLANIPSNTHENSQDFLSGEVEEAIKKAIAELPEKCQVVFSLSRYSDLSNKEIAEELDISVKGVEKHISRALRELRVTLKPYLNTITIFFILKVGLSIFKLLYT